MTPSIHNTFVVFRTKKFPNGRARRKVSVATLLEWAKEPNKKGRFKELVVDQVLETVSRDSIDHQEKHLLHLLKAGREALDKVVLEDPENLKEIRRLQKNQTDQLHELREARLLAKHDDELDIRLKMKPKAKPKKKAAKKAAKKKVAKKKPSKKKKK